MEKWNKKTDVVTQEISDTVINHYTREMQGYNAHVFFVRLVTENELVEKWNIISKNIALKIQSKTEDSIERSNFYICYMISDQVDMQTKRKIEYDPFCAKKYVIDNCDFSDRGNGEICQYLENKLFSIKSLSGKDRDIEPVHIKKICLQNFRGFKGKAELKLQDRNGNAASYVLIYAPNGCGKTSIFDGIEYALKGKVDYLLATKQISNFHGVIYHNRDNKTEKASVELQLNDDRVILRNVASIDKKGDDSRVGSLTKVARSIVGDSDESGKWNGILLPYAKIEHFISARKPEERYAEWFNNAPDLKDKQAEFEKESRKQRTLLIKLAGLEKDINRLNGDIQKMGNGSKSIETINKLIDQFNQKSVVLDFESENASIELLSISGQVEDYDSLINHCKALKREVERALSNSKNEYIQIEKYNSASPALLREKKAREIELGKEIEAIQRIVLDYQIYETKQKELKAILKKLQELEQEIVPYEQIDCYGKNEVSLFHIKRREILDNRHVLETQYKELFEDRENIIKKRDETVYRIEQLNERLRSREKAVSLSKEVTEKEKILAAVQQGADEIKHKIIDIDKKVLECTDKIEQLEQLYLSDNIGTCSFEDISNCKRFLGSNMAEKLQLLVKEYETTAAAAKKASLVCEKADNVLVEIQNMGIYFQSLHKENCECPLCHTKFDSPETLQSLMSETSAMTSELASHRRELLDRERVIIEEYRKICDEVSVAIHKGISILSEKINDISEMKNQMAESYNLYKEKIHVVEEEKRILLEALASKVIDHTIMGYTPIQVNSYYDSIIDQRKKLEELLSVFTNRINTLDYRTKQSIVDIEVCNKEIDDMNKNKDLLNMEQFWSNQQSDFDEEYEVLKTRIRNATENVERIKEEIKKVEYSIQHDITVKREFIRNAIVEQKSIKSELQEFIELLEYDDSEANKRESALKVRINQISQLGELLQQIIEENGARNYYAEYKNKVKELDKLELQKQKSEENIQKQNEIINEIKEELQTLLAEYFGQSSMDEIYQKIDAHDIMKHLRYELSFNDNQKGELVIHALENIADYSDYRPEIYFSTAQLNTVAFSSFFSRALNTYTQLPIQSIFIDDPIGSYDDMNVLGFADLIRSILENSKCQIVMSTHDETVFRILKRKLNSEYYSSCFIELPIGNSAE